MRVHVHAGVCALVHTRGEVGKAGKVGKPVALQWFAAPNL